MRTLALSIACILSSAAFAADTPPDQLVRETAEEVLQALRDDPGIGAAPTPELIALVEAKVLPHFDFEAMTRLALARHWNRADAGQQSALVTQFRTLLVRTYSTALIEYRDETLDYLPVTPEPDADVVLVRTRIRRSPSPIEINYRMRRTPDGWKAYDVLVDGVSLVINYRSSFNTTVERSGIEGLIEQIAAKNRENAR